MFFFAGHCSFVRKMYVEILLFGAFRDAVSVLLRGAWFVRPKDIVWALAIRCVSLTCKCFAFQSMFRLSKICGLGFCYRVRLTSASCFLLATIDLLLG